MFEGLGIGTKDTEFADLFKYVEVLRQMLSIIVDAITKLLGGNLA